MMSPLSQRSQEIFSHIVEAYVETGEPIGSKTLSARLGMGLSPATIRNVMAELETSGMLYAPHTSAGRLPTEKGLRTFVQGLLESGGLSEEEEHAISRECRQANRSCEDALKSAATLLSGLAGCAGLVLAPKTDDALRHIEVVPLSGDRALVVLVLDSGLVENRIIEMPARCPPSAFVEASNYLNARLVGHRLSEVYAKVSEEVRGQRTALDDAANRLVASGLAVWSGDSGENVLIVRGQSQLLQHVTALQDVEHVRSLFDILERQQNLMQLLQSIQNAEGVQIFIGSANPLFASSGTALVVAPLRGAERQIIGAVGVIGPSRSHYRRVIPMVDYTAQVVTRLLGKGVLPT